MPELLTHACEVCRQPARPYYGRFLCERCLKARPKLPSYEVAQLRPALVSARRRKKAKTSSAQERTDKRRKPSVRRDEAPLRGRRAVLIADVRAIAARCHAAPSDVWECLRKPATEEAAPRPWSVLEVWLHWLAETAPQGAQQRQANAARFTDPLDGRLPSRVRRRYLR